MATENNEMLAMEKNEITLYIDGSAPASSTHGQVGLNRTGYESGNSHFVAGRVDTRDFLCGVRTFGVHVQGQKTCRRGKGRASTFAIGCVDHSLFHSKRTHPSFFTRGSGKNAPRSSPWRQRSTAVAAAPSMRHSILVCG